MRTVRRQVRASLHKEYEPPASVLPYRGNEVERILAQALLEPGYFNRISLLHSTDPNNVTYSFKVKHLLIKKAKKGLGVTVLFPRLRRRFAFNFYGVSKCALQVKIYKANLGQMS